MQKGNFCKRECRIWAVMSTGEQANRLKNFQIRNSFLLFWNWSLLIFHSITLGTLIVHVYYLTVSLGADAEDSWYHVIPDRKAAYIHFGSYRTEILLEGRRRYSLTYPFIHLFHTWNRLRSTSPMQQLSSPPSSSTLQLRSRDWNWKDENGFN